MFFFKSASRLINLLSIYTVVWYSAPYSLQLLVTAPNSYAIAHPPADHHVDF